MNKGRFDLVTQM